MVAVVPMIAGAAGSVLLNKLWDAIAASGNSSPAIDEGSSVGGVGRVYEAGSEPVMAGGVKPSIIINSPNAEGTQPSSQSQTQQPGNASATAGAQSASTNVDDIAAQHRNEVMAAEAAGGNQVVAEDPATAPINGSDVLNALLAAAGASALGYAGSRVFSGNAKQGVPNVEPTVGAPNANASSPSKAVAVASNNAAVDPNARPTASNVIDAEFTPVRDPLNIAGGDPTLQLAAPQQKLNAPQPQQGQQQVAGNQNNKALPPAQNKIITLPDQTSGPTIQAESGVFDAAKPSQKISLQGKQYVVQDGMIFDGRTKSLIGEVSKFIPKNQQGVARTLGILKRGLR